MPTAFILPETRLPKLLSGLGGGFLIGLRVALRRDGNHFQSRIIRVYVSHGFGPVEKLVSVSKIPMEGEECELLQSRAKLIAAKCANRSIRTAAATKLHLPGCKISRVRVE